MRYFKSFRSALLLLAMSGRMLQAQETTEKEPKKPSGRLAWLMATSIPDKLENPVSVMTGSDVVQVTLSKRATSEPVKIPADGLIRLVRKLDNPTKDPNKPAYAILAQAVVPKEIEKALIILGPAPKKEGSDLVFLAKVQDLAHFKGGDYMFMNLTTLNIAVKLGDKKIGLKPGDTSISEAGSISDATNMPVSYNFFDASENKWKLISASTVVVQPSRREIRVFSWDTEFDRVDYHGITFPVTP